MSIRIRITVIGLLPLVLYDFATSVGGGFAIFNINPYSFDWNFDNAVLFFFPVALALGAISINFWTKEILVQEEGPMIVIQFLWLFLIAFDFYSTFLGVAGFMSGAGLLSFPHDSIRDVLSTFSLERWGFALLGTAAVVLSPMCVNLMLGFERRIN